MSEDEPTRSPAWTTVESLFDQELGARPADRMIALMRPVERQGREPREWLWRAVRHMRRSNFDIRNVPPQLARFIGRDLSGVMTDSWGGIVLPYTYGGRHRKIDAYLKETRWANFGPGTLMIDVGCGFPPKTTIDSAVAHPDWKLIGADIAFDQYVLYDNKENYACIDTSGRVRYFQASREVASLVLNRDPESTAKRFRDQFEVLLPLLPKVDQGEPVTVERAGYRLVRHPLKAYERENLQFVTAGLGSNLPMANVIRAVNVTPYYDDKFRQEAEHWACETLQPGGLFICGMNTGDGGCARLSIYRKEGEQLQLKEFIFDLGSVRPLQATPFFSYHEDERELVRLAKVLAILRSDASFTRDLDRRIDTLLEQFGLAVRDRDGYLAEHPKGLSLGAPMIGYDELIKPIEAEFVDRAVDILCSAGLQAWRNPTDNICVVLENSTG